MAKRTKVVCCYLVGLLWIAAQVGVVLLEDSGYDTILDWASFFLLVYLIYKLRDMFTLEGNKYSQLRWLSLCVICVNLMILSGVIQLPLSAILHPDPEFGLWWWLLLVAIYLPFIYFTLMADISIFRKWKSEVFHIRCMLIYAICFTMLLSLAYLAYDEIKVMWAHWVDVIFYCAILLLFIIGFITTFGSEAKLVFPLENRKIKWQETVVPSMIVGFVFYTFILVLIGILINF